MQKKHVENGRVWREMGLAMIDLKLPSPIDEFKFNNRLFFVKRDDLINEEFSGNKARKLYGVLKGDFNHIKRVVSYGSNQSNLMYSLSVLAKLKGWDFIYYTDHIPSYLKLNPIGNYAKALQNGTKFVVGEKFINKSSFDTLCIPEGGRSILAQEGVEILAKEILKWKNDKDLDIFLPSGTGTTALFLSKALIERDSNIKVYTTPCVGDKEYLFRQFQELEKDSKYYPVVLDLDKKYHFGKLYKEFYQIWLELQKSGIVFDMLYDPKGWMVVTKYQDIFEKKLLYIHQGGLLGNSSMLQRYIRKYPQIEG